MKEPLDTKGLTLAVVYLYYPQGPQYNKNKPLNELKKIIARLSCRKMIVCVNNASSDGPVQKISEEEYEISGDNSLFEFSGWQKGIDLLRDKGLRCDMYLFVNDMFLHDSVFDRRLLNDKAIAYADKHKAIVGRKMNFPVAGEIMGQTITSYIRTHLFLMPAQIVDKLGGVISIDTDLKEKFFSLSYAPDGALFSKGAPLSADLKDCIFTYLVSRWNRKKPYTAASFDLFKGKVVSILNALMLSKRINDFGYPLVTLKEAQDIHRVTENNRFWTAPRPVYRRLTKHAWDRYNGFFRKAIRKHIMPHHL